MVRTRREAAAWWPRFHGPLCGRCGHGLRKRARCAPGLDRAAETSRLVRSGPPPHQDKAGGVPITFGGEETADRPRKQKLRLARVHPLLVAISQGLLGGEAEEGRRPLRAVRQTGAAVVPQVPTCALAWQHEQLTRKLRGHDAYYGVRGNYAALVRFRYELGRVWQKWLNRRSNQSGMPWERFNRLLKRYPLLEPRIRCPLQPRAANP